MLNKDKIKEEFEKKFKCIDSSCDGRGNIPHQVGEGDWEAEQCQFHAEYLFPILAHLSAQYEKLIEECIGESRKCECGGIFCTCGAQQFNQFRNLIRTSLQERGIKIK